MRKYNGLTAGGAAAAAAVLLLGLLSAAAPASAATDDQPDPSVGPFIVGGGNASQPYPAMVSLQTQVGDNPDFHFCGAVLVAARYAVTNAHCVTLDDASPVPAGVLHLRIGSPDRTSGGIVVGVSAVLPHERWDWATGDDPIADIAVLRLDRPMPFRPLGIASRPKPKASTRLLGWGLTEPDATSTPTMLQELDTRLIDPQQCGAAGFTAGELCVANPRIGAGACYGDSGGPALQRITGHHWQLVGGASRETDPVCGAGPATVYTDTTYYRDWIWRAIWTGKVPPRIAPPVTTAARSAAARAFTWAGSA